MRGLEFELYRAKRGLLRRTQWRWRLIAGNGKTIAESGESYNNRSDAMEMIGKIKRLAADAHLRREKM